MWDRYSVFIVASALLIIAAVGGWRGYQYLEAKKAAEAGAAFDKAIELSEQNKHAEAEAAFNSLAATAPSGYRMLARLRAAAEVASSDPQAAVKLYEDISTDRSADTLEQELAKVRAAGLLLETTSYPNMLQRLEPEAAPEAAFRHTARELLALSAWRANDTTAARKWLDLIANDAETPPGLRSRTEALQALLPPVAKS
nr:tetratricopeptide repeat protein [Bradyrhizobium sp. dw_78]